VRYRKRPVVIEAIQFTDTDSATKIRETFGEDIHFGLGCLIIRTLEGDMRADAGDWIIRGVKGEVYPCRDDIFRATYEPAPSGVLADNTNQET
jgi:hypothetical protein